MNPIPRLSDPVFDTTLTLREAFHVLTAFIGQFNARAPQSTTLLAADIALERDGSTSDPAQLDDFIDSARGVLDPAHVAAAPARRRRPRPTSLLDALVLFAIFAYLASLLMLLGIPTLAEVALDVARTDILPTHGPRVPAFTELMLAATPHATPICWSVLGLSLLALAWTYRRFKAWRERLPWVGLLAALNLYVGTQLMLSALMGLVLLPILANRA